MVKIKSATHMVVFWKKNSRYPGEPVGSRREHGFSGRGHGCECDESSFIEKTRPPAFHFRKLIKNQNVQTDNPAKRVDVTKCLKNHGL